MMSMPSRGWRGRGRGGGWVGVGGGGPGFVPWMDRGRGRGRGGPRGALNLRERQAVQDWKEDGEWRKKRKERIKKERMERQAQGDISERSRERSGDRGFRDGGHKEGGSGLRSTSNFRSEAKGRMSMPNPTAGGRGRGRGGVGSGGGSFTRLKPWERWNFGSGRNNFED